MGRRPAERSLKFACATAIRRWDSKLGQVPERAKPCMGLVAPQPGIDHPSPELRSVDGLNLSPGAGCLLSPGFSAKLNPAWLELLQISPNTAWVSRSQRGKEALGESMKPRAAARPNDPPTNGMRSVASGIRHWPQTALALSMLIATKPIASYRRSL